MTTTDLGYLVQFAFLIGASLFAIGLHQMNSPATARNGNRLSALGMTIAVVAELGFVANSSPGIGNWLIILGGCAVCIVLASLVYYFVERPSRDYSQSIRYKQQKPQPVI